MKTYRDDKGRWLTEMENGNAYVSDEHGEPLTDEEGFMTFVGDFGL